MRVPFLHDFRSMEDDAASDLPQATLRDEALPDVAHSEGAVARDVHERIRLGEPPRRLRVEGAPHMRPEADGRRIVEIERTVLRQPPDGVYIR